MTVKAEDRILYPIPDAAKVMGISRSSVYLLLASERLASVKIASRRLIPRAAIEEFVARAMGDAA